jgi:hypothetical protein
MKYYLLMYHEEKAGAELPKAEMDAWLAKINAYGDALKKAGVLVKSEGLLPTSAATTVRIRDGKKLTTHGPFAETKEQLGGIYILDCKNLDEAIEWAYKSPQTQFGSVEVRPAWDMDLNSAIAAARERGMLRS